MRSILDAETNIEDVLYQLSRLYERWSLEQQLISKREAEMSQAIEGFEQKIKALQVLEKNIRADTQEKVSEIAIEVLKHLKKEMNAILAREMENFGSEWKPLLHAIGEQQKSDAKKINYAKFTIVAAVLGLTFVAGAVLCR